MSEPSASRENYQLEPSLVIKDQLTKKIDYATTYIDIVNKIGYDGGLTNNHNRLFDNEFYSYDPKISFDKFVNFSQYYWLKSGPDSIQITSSGVSTQQSFAVTYNPVNDAFENLPDGTVATLLKPENKATLQTVLTYHVVSGTMDFDAIKSAIEKGKGKAELKTVAGGKLIAKMNGKHNITITDENGSTANITTYDVMQSNGVIHVIDKVVLPKM